MKFFDGTAGKGPLQQTKMLSSQFCLLNQLWFDVFGDLSLQTCYTCISVVYLKCFKAFFVFTGSQSESGWDLFVLFYLFYFIFFSVSVKVLLVTPLVSGIFVHRAFCAYFLRIERVVEMRRFLWWTQENH